MNNKKKIENILEFRQQICINRVAVQGRRNPGGWGQGGPAPSPFPNFLTLTTNVFYY